MPRKRSMRQSLLHHAASPGRTAPRPAPRTARSPQQERRRGQARQSEEERRTPGPRARPGGPIARSRRLSPRTACRGAGPAGARRRGAVLLQRPREPGPASPGRRACPTSCARTLSPIRWNDSISCAGGITVFTPLFAITSMLLRSSAAVASVSRRNRLGRGRGPPAGTRRGCDPRPRWSPPPRRC